jgi:hypothetical protein
MVNRPRAAAGRPQAGLEVEEKLLTSNIHAANRTNLRTVKRSGYRHAMTLEPWSTEQAERLIAPLGNRWVPVQAFARQAGRVAASFSAAGDVLVAAAFLHDVGCASSLNRLGFHPVDGTHFLRDNGQERLACLVAHHSGARCAAEERGLVNSWPPSADGG